MAPHVGSLVKRHMHKAAMDMAETVGCVAVCVATGGAIQTASQVTSALSQREVEKSGLGKMCKNLVKGASKLASKASPVATVIGGTSCALNCK